MDIAGSVNVTLVFLVKVELQPESIVHLKLAFFVWVSRLLLM